MNDMPTLPSIPSSTHVFFSQPGLLVLRRTQDTTHSEIQSAQGRNSFPLPECVGCVGCARACGIGHSAASEGWGLGIIDEG